MCPGAARGVVASPTVDVRSGNNSTVGDAIEVFLCDRAAGKRQSALSKVVLEHQESPTCIEDFDEVSFPVRTIDEHQHSFWHLEARSLPVSPVDSDSSSVETISPLQAKHDPYPFWS